MNLYRCGECGKTVSRDSKKRRIRSLCGETGKFVRLRRADRGLLRVFLR